MADVVQKLDQGKPDLSYLMDAPIAMTGLARVMTMGAKKYSRDNWKLYDDENRLVAALLRHLMAWKGGELMDPESGESHLSHVLANAVMLAETNPPHLARGELESKEDD